MTPAAITFTGTVEFCQSCAECRAAVQAFVAQAVSQANVRSVTLRATDKHAHATAAPQPKPTTGLREPTDESLFPVSDTNGSHPDDVDRHLQTLR